MDSSARYASFFVSAPRPAIVCSKHCNLHEARNVGDGGGEEEEEAGEVINELLKDQTRGISRTRWRRSRWPNERAPAFGCERLIQAQLRWTSHQKLRPQSETKRPVAVRLGSAFLFPYQLPVGSVFTVASRDVIQVMLEAAKSAEWTATELNEIRIPMCGVFLFSTALGWVDERPSVANSYFLSHAKCLVSRAIRRTSFHSATPQRRQSGGVTFVITHMTRFGHWRKKRSTRKLRRETWKLFISLFSKTLNGKNLDRKPKQNNIPSVDPQSREILSQ